MGAFGFITAQSWQFYAASQGLTTVAADRMGLLVLYCLSLAEMLPQGIAQEAAFGYLAVQVVLSYFISGQVKIVNPEWRNGRALQDVFRFSAYPVSEALRGLTNHPRLLWSMSWGVMVFEVLFPLSLLNPTALIAALALAASFHLSNACFFGLNRFLWFWISAYPSILWLQTRAHRGCLSVVMINNRAAFSYLYDEAVPDFSAGEVFTVMDAHCALCARGARWIAGHDKANEFRIIPLQSEIWRRFDASLWSRS